MTTGKKHGLIYKGVNNAPIQIACGFLPRCAPMCSSLPSFKAHKDSKQEAATLLLSQKIHEKSQFVVTAVSKFNIVAAGETVKSIIFSLLRLNQRIIPFKFTLTNLSLPNSLALIPLSNPSLSSSGHNDFCCAGNKAAFRETGSRKGKSYVDKGH